MDHVEDRAVGVDHERHPLVRQEAGVALRAELRGHDTIGVRQQGEPEGFLLVEKLLLLDRVGTDADRLRAYRGELGRQVPEVAALLGAAVGHCRRVEEQHNRAVGQEAAERTGCACLVRKLEIGKDVTCAHPFNVERKPAFVLA